jgi:hypothetical protein
MTVLRVVSVVLLLAVAATLAVLASDVLHWRRTMQHGDAALAQNPPSATWRPATLAPSGVTKKLLGLDLALRFRGAQQAFSAVQAAGAGYDNGLSESRTRGELEAVLAGIAQSSNHAIASRADNLLGILAFSDATQTGPIVPAPADQSVADFQAAIRLDPTNTDAKFNLERLLQELVAKGTRVGPDATGGGPSKGRRGAGGGLPGRGY